MHHAESLSLSLDPQTLYRLPWTLSDNAMTWLEPTRQCNITCDACFHDNDPESRKTLTQIEYELKSMLRLRRCDAMLIGGGEPLTHPDILEITRLVKSFHVKPILITNGVGLELEQIRELKRAGIFGFTFHVDAHQTRPGWEGKSETELNALRQHFAEMVHEVGGLSCAYNVTIFPDTLNDVPAIVEWATQNINKVNILTLIPVRLGHRDDPFDFYIGTKKIDLDDTPYVSDQKYTNLSALDVYEQIRKVLPGYQFSSYLGGTALPHSPKWLLGSHIGSATGSCGNMGAKSMEILQTIHHTFKGCYLAYTKPALNRKARLTLFFGVFDRSVRKAAAKYVRTVLRNPLKLFKRLYVQSISVVQPVDILATGERDNCDGCPNKTFWQDRLVSACQLEEYLYYGRPFSVVPHGEKVPER
ncbi:radical SAM protein [Acidobacteriota bacterium]